MIFSGLPESVVQEVRLSQISIASQQGIQARYVKGVATQTQIKTSQGAILESGPQAQFKIE